MFSPLRNRFGIPGVISVIALVFAMFGGAYAATNSSEGGKATASAKAKQGPRGKTGKTGKTGPAGPAGPQGPAGAKGDSGAVGSNGTNGKDGTNGKSVVTGAATLAECPAVGGSTVEVAGEPATKKKVCNGKNGEDGETGFTETLPSGATETGTWWFQGNGGSLQTAPISFPIPLSPADAASIKEVHFSVEKAEDFEPECPGTINEPAAEPGAFCVFVNEESSFSAPPNGIYRPDFEEPGVEVAGIGMSGVLFWYETAGVNTTQGGSFAVTAP